MKRILVLAAVALFMFCGIVMAGTVYNSQIVDTTFNAVTTAVNSTATAVAGYDKIAFFVAYDETEVGNSISAAVTMQTSYDNSNWMSASFYDYAGGATLQTSETLSSDGWYYCWFNKDLVVPYVRMVVTATNTDADDLLDVDAYIVAKE